MKKIILSGIFLFSGFMMSAQVSGTLGADIYSRTIDINQKNLAFGLSEAEFELVKDQAYANPEFVSGVIFQDNKPIRAGVPMRYNAHADEIEIKSDPNASEVGSLVKDPNIFVKMGDQFYVLIPYKGSIERGSYFNVLHDGDNYSLYKKVTATFKEGQPAQSTYSRDTPPSFQKETTYYLVEKDNFLELPRSRNRLQRVFTSGKKEMSDYIKNNKLDLRKEKDLAKAVEHFDSLHNK